MRQETVRACWHRALDQAKLPRRRLYDTRQTYASRLMETEPTKLVSELLGHSTIAITADVYGHLSPGYRRRALMRDRAVDACTDGSRMAGGSDLVSCCAPVAKLANATDLKSVGSNPLWVRSPPGAWS